VLGDEPTTLSVDRFAALEHAVVGTEGGYPQLYEPTLSRLEVKRHVAVELPGLSATPGRITNLGPTLGNATTDVLEGLLGVHADELQRLRQSKVI
jgi:hypothetical protein